MFSKTIIDSDAFLDMHQSTQLLYFHLSMRADDDGFINNPKSIMRNVKCSEDDLKLLAMKKFIIPFENGIVVIKHWKINNYIRSDRYNETKYKNELSMLNVDENNAYSLSSQQKLISGIPDDNQVPDSCQPNGDTLDTQVRLGKVSIESTIVEKTILHELSTVQGYPFDYKKDLDYIRTLTVEFPTKNLLETVKSWKVWLFDHPLKKTSNPRSQIRNWLKPKKWEKKPEKD